MISAIRKLNEPVSHKLLVVLVVLSVSGVGGYLFGNLGFGFRELVIVVLAWGLGLLLVAPGQSLLRAGFYVWIVSFAIGWRQIWVTQSLRFHPSEALIWLLFALLIARRLIQKERFSWPTPAPVTALLVISVVGAAIGLDRGIPSDVVVANLKLFLVLIPVFGVSQEMIRGPRQWRVAIVVVSLVAFYIALLGLTEFYVPSAVAPLQGFFGEKPVLLSQQGFHRADFTFFGGAITGFLLSAALFPALSLAIAKHRPEVRLFGGATAGLCAVGVYVSGSRGPWFGVAAALLAYVLVNRKTGWFLLLLVSAAMVAFAPPEFYRNVAAVYDPVTYYDTSVQRRDKALEGALNMIQDSPLWGNGLGASGWVHSDLLQIGADLGIPALLFFLWWFLGRMWKLYHVSRGEGGASPSDRAHAAGLLAGLCAALVGMAGEAIIVLPHLIIPLWFLMAMADRLMVMIGSAEAVAERGE